MRKDEAKQGVGNFELFCISNGKELNESDESEGVIGQDKAIVMITSELVLTVDGARRRTRTACFSS